MRPTTGGLLAPNADPQWRQRFYDANLYGQSTIGQEMAAAAFRDPGVSIEFYGTERATTVTSLAEIHRRSMRVADGLRRLGVGAGDRVAVQIPNWVEGAIAFQALMYLGAVAVPIVHIYGPTEVGFILRQSQARAYIVPDRWRNVDYLERLDGLGDTPSVEHLIVIGDRLPPGACSWDSIEAGGDNPITEVPADPDAICLIIYTSGTTAEPKGVQHTHNTLLAEVRSTRAALDNVTGPVLAAFPAGHIAGVLNVLRMSLFAIKTILMDRWDPAEAARLISERLVSATSGAPVFLASLLEERIRQGLDLSSLQSYLVGAASVPPALVEEAQAAGIPAFRCYGSSEHPVVTTGTPLDPLAERAMTDGRPTVGNELRLVDDDGNDVAPGRDGELLCRGPEQFVGYTNVSLNDDAFTPGGWFRTGDVGRLKPGGWLTITDRKKDVVIRGGENISSKEVEDLLSRHPAVAEVAVVAAPDPRMGETVCAFVIPRSGATLSLEEVQGFFREAGVARQKTPERLEIVEDLPRSAAGKVRKVDLRARLSVHDLSG